MAVTTPSSFSVFVRCPSSKSACIEARGCEEVGEVCQRGLAREGFDRLNAYSQVYISCGGRPLSPRATLEKAGVEALCTLHIHPNAAAISVRLSLRERVRGLPHRLQRHPESLADELDALRLALEDAVAPLERTHLDTEAVGSLGGVLEALASLSLLGSDPRLSDLSFAWLERSLTALKTQLSAALRLVPSQLVPAHACMLLALEGLLPLLLYKVQDTSNIHRERVVWAAKKMRSLASRCRSASLHARPPLTSAPLESQAGPDKLLFQLAFGQSRLVAGAADNVQFVASGLPASLRIIEEQRRELDAALQGISSLAEVLSCFSTAKGVRKCPGGAPPSLQHHSSWLQLKCHLFVPVANQVARLCAQLHGVCEQFEHMAPDAEDPAAGGTAAPEVVAAQLGRASRWLAQLLCTAFACTEAIDVPGPPEEPGLLTAAGCYQHLAGATQAPIMQMVLQDVRGHRMLTRALLVSPELRDYIPTAAKMYHLECWSAGGASDDEDENCDDECGTLVVKRGQDLLESSYSELLPVRPAHLHKNLKVRFEGEPAYGAGVVREWLTVLAPRLFQPELGLFVRASGNPQAILPSYAACVQPNHKQYLRVAGRVMGFALLHGVPLGFHLASAFYKGLAGQQAGLEDLAETDPQLAQSLQSLVGAEDPANFGLTFTLSLDHLGQSVEVPLGETATQPVTAANCCDYVSLAVEHVLDTRIADELAAVKQGLLDVLKVCPSRLFSLAALNSLLAGSSGSLCATQWRQHTRCIGWEGWRGLARSSDDMEADGPDEQQEPEVLRWFWMLVGAMREQQRAALLRFWTSLPSLPCGGFGGLPQPLKLVRAEPASQRLPQAHTCFFELVLPDYPDVLALAGGLAEAVAHAEGFGIV